MMTQRFSKVFDHIWLGAKFSYNFTTRESWGITTLWNPNHVIGKEICLNPHFIVVGFVSKIHRWNMFNFYAPNTHNGRLIVWEEVTNITNSMRNGNMLYMTNFNTLLYPSKKMGNLEDFSRSMYDLADFLGKNALLETDL